MSSDMEPARDLVLLHGWGSNPEVWRQLRRLLARRFRVHAPALPYGGGAARETDSLAALADRLAAGAPPRCAVCGWSLGGLIALAWAQRAPRQITHLALVATTPCFVRRPDWPHGLESWSVQDFARGLARQPAVVLARFIALQARGDARAARVARHLRQSLTGRSQMSDTAALQLGLSLLIATDLRRALPCIDQPSLVLHGARDAVVPVAAGRYLAQNMTHAQLTVFEDAAHVPFASQPEASAAALANFLDG